MAGLLYKDFVAIKGKFLVTALLLLTVLFLILRLCIAGGDIAVTENGIPTVQSEETGVQNGNAGITEAAMVDDTEMTGFIFDTMLAMLIVSLEIGLAVVPVSTMMNIILRTDEKNKTRAWIEALPMKKNAYIASKYLFFGIVYYVGISLLALWISIFVSNSGANILTDFMNVNMQGILILFTAELIVVAIELPILLTAGTKKGMMVKRIVFMLILVALFAYLLFGDLSIFEHLDLYAILQWCEQNQVLVTLISIGLPIAAGILYWLSYIVTCRLNRNREVDDYE